MYWYCLELIAGEVSKNKITFELEHDAEIIAHDTGVHYERVNEMMAYMVDLGLFEQDTGVITCLKMAQRLDQSMTSSSEMRKMISNIKSNNHDRVMTKSDSVMQDKIRLDENREDKSIKNTVAIAPVKQGKQFKIPLPQTVAQYMVERDIDFNSANKEAESFCDFYSSKGWMVGKNKMKDWKAAVRNWLKNYKPSASANDNDTSWIHDMDNLI